MNKIFFDSKLLSPAELAAEANKLLSKPIFSLNDYCGENSRVEGIHCNCNGNGVFNLLPVDNLDVIEG